MSVGAANCDPAEVDERIRKLREARERKAALEGKSPHDVSLGDAGAAAVLDGRSEAPPLPANNGHLSGMQKRVLDAARQLYGASGTALGSEIAALLGVTDKAVYSAIKPLRDAGKWPYAASKGGRPPATTAAAPAKPKPPAESAAPRPVPAPRPARETAPPPLPAVDGMAAYRAVGDVLEAFARLDRASRKWAAAYIAEHLSGE